MTNFFRIRRREGLICLFLIPIIIVAYCQIHTHDSVNFDDDKYVTENPYLCKGITCDSIAWAFTNIYYSYWHPLTWLSHMLDYQFYGLNPMGHHWTSLQIHIANAILLFILLNCMTGAVWQSAFVAALFAVHPINTESVAWVTERKNVLSTFFWMLTILAYASYAKHPGPKKYLIVFIIFALGLMAKPMLVTLPLVLLLLDYWPLSRFKSFQPSGNYSPDAGKSIVAGSLEFSFFYLTLEKVPFLILSARSSIISFLSVQRFEVVVPIESVPINLRTIALT